jgi:hypothetical protein
MADSQMITMNGDVFSLRIKEDDILVSVSARETKDQKESCIENSLHCFIEIPIKANAIDENDYLFLGYFIGKDAEALHESEETKISCEISDNSGTCGVQHAEIDQEGIPKKLYGFKCRPLKNNPPAYGIYLTLKGIVSYDTGNAPVFLYRGQNRGNLVEYLGKVTVRKRKPNVAIKKFWVFKGEYAPRHFKGATWDIDYAEDDVLVELVADDWSRLSFTGNDGLKRTEYIEMNPINTKVELRCTIAGRFVVKKAWEPTDENTATVEEIV